MLHHFKLQLTNRAQEHRPAHLGFEHLDGTFFTQLLQAGLQLFGAQRVFQDHGHEHLGGEKRQTGELQGRTVGDGVTELHATVGGEANDVTRIGLVHRFASLAQKCHHRGGAQFFAAALYFQFHARRITARGHAHKGNAVAVVGVHIGLHFEHHA